MAFIDGGDHSDAHQRKYRPIAVPRPLSASASTIEQPCKDCILSEVSKLANQKVSDYETLAWDFAQQSGDERLQKASGVRSREKIARSGEYQRCPDNRWEPV